MRCVSRSLFALALVAQLGACKDSGSGGAGETTTGTGSTTDGDEAATGDETAETGSDDSGSGGTDDEGPWATFDERPCPDDSFVTYENFGWPHMLTFCNGCHSGMLPADMRQGAPVEVNFASIEDVRAQAERIWVRAGDQHATMPPVGPAAIEERFLLGEWLACGAPTNADLGME